VPSGSAVLHPLGVAVGVYEVGSHCECYHISVSRRVAWNETVC
jgi:hypothetical protein